MNQVITVGCDLHDKSMLLAIDAGAKVLIRTWANTRSRRQAMIADLRRRAQAVGAERIVLAYEASGLGFVLHDELVAAGIECCVLAPTGIERSQKHRKGKTDERDARHLLELLRAHVLAGNKLPAVWIPDPQTRDDRELTRARQELSDKVTRVKAQVRCLLKRNGLEAGDAPVKSWTPRYRQWLGTLQGRPLGPGASAALACLVRQLESLEQEMATLQQSLEHLAQTPRYAPGVESLCQDKGIGVLTAMVFLTELGDLTRFANRRQVGAFLGLVPSSDESGPDCDRKGHITHQGPARVRKVLNQAVWSQIRSDPAAADWYRAVVARNPKHKKVAVVGAMRRMAIRCWHRGRQAQPALAPPSGGPPWAAAGPARVTEPPAGPPEGPPRGRARQFLTGDSR